MSMYTHLAGLPFIASVEHAHFSVCSLSVSDLSFT